MKRWACISPKHMFASARDNRIVDLSLQGIFFAPLRSVFLVCPQERIARTVDMVESNL